VYFLVYCFFLCYVCYLRVNKDEYIKLTQVGSRAHVKIVSRIVSYHIFVHQAFSISNNNNSRKLNYKHLIKYYNLLQNWQKPFTVEV